MNVTLINQQQNTAIEFTEEVIKASPGTLLLLKDSVYLRIRKSNLPTVLDWEKIQTFDKTIPTIEDEYTSKLTINTDLYLAASNGIDANISEKTIKLQGNFHYGAGEPEVVKDLLEYEIGVYLNILNNSIYIWNPIIKKWHNFDKALTVISNKKLEYGYDSVTNVLNIPSFNPVARINVSKKIGLTATVDAKETISATDEMLYKWEQIGGTTNVSFANASALSTAIFVNDPGNVILRLTVIDKNGLMSSSKISLNFSYYIFVLGINYNDFSFETLGEAFDWIRTYDLKNENKYVIEVCGTTQEKFDVIRPTASQVIFKNGHVSANIYFAEKKEYIWNGANSVHLLQTKTNTVEITNGAKVTFNNFQFTGNAQTSSLINVKNATLLLNNCIIITNGDAISVHDGYFSLNQSIITSASGQCLEVIESDYKISSSDLSTAEGEAVGSFINSNGEVRYSKFTQGTHGIVTVLFDNNKPKNIQIFSNVFSSLAPTTNGDFVNCVLIKNSGETVFSHNTVISKATALCLICPGIQASHNYIKGAYSIVANQHANFLAQDYIARYNGLILNDVHGKLAISALNGTNYYEL